MEVTVRRVGEEFMPQLDDWIQHQFLPAMPLMTAFGVDTSRSLPCPHRPTPGTVNIYLRAEDDQGTTVGVAVIKEAVDFQGGPDDSTPDWDKMADFMDYIEREARLEELPGRKVELLVLSVGAWCRGRGVAGRLVAEAEAAARAEGFTTMYVCCTSEYSAMAVRRRGWKEHYRLAYSDYPRDVSLVPTPPHHHVYFYVKHL